MLRKTVLPVIAIALYVPFLLAVSACGGSGSDARESLPSLDRPASFTDKQWLGKQLFFDTNLSEPAGQACAACHAPQVGWTGPDPMISLRGAVYEGDAQPFFDLGREPGGKFFVGGQPPCHGKPRRAQHSHCNPDAECLLPALHG